MTRKESPSIAFVDALLFLFRNSDFRLVKTRKRWHRPSDPLEADGRYNQNSYRYRAGPTLHGTQICNEKGLCSDYIATHKDHTLLYLMLQKLRKKMKKSASDRQDNADFDSHTGAGPRELVHRPGPPRPGTRSVAKRSDPRPRHNMQPSIGENFTQSSKRSTMAWLFFDLQIIWRSIYLMCQCSIRTSKFPVRLLSDKKQ